MDDYSNASLGINTKGKAVAKPSDYSNKSLGINKNGRPSPKPDDYSNKSLGISSSGKGTSGKSAGLRSHLVENIYPIGPAWVTSKELECLEFEYENMQSEKEDSNSASEFKVDNVKWTSLDEYTKIYYTGNEDTRASEINITRTDSLYNIINTDSNAMNTLTAIVAMKFTVYEYHESAIVDYEINSDRITINNIDISVSTSSKHTSEYTYQYSDIGIIDIKVNDIRYSIGDSDEKYMYDPNTTLFTSSGVTTEGLSLKDGDKLKIEFLYNVYVDGETSRIINTFGASDTFTVEMNIIED